MDVRSNNISRQSFMVPVLERHFNADRSRGSSSFSLENNHKRFDFDLFTKIIIKLLSELKQRNPEQRPATHHPQQQKREQSTLPTRPLTIAERQITASPSNLQQLKPEIAERQITASPSNLQQLKPELQTETPVTVVKPELRLPEEGLKATKPVSVDLSRKQKEIISALFSQNTSASKSNNKVEVSVEDKNKDSQLSINDRVVNRNKQGKIISTHSLTKNDIYDIHFRESMIKNAEKIGSSGWDFERRGLAKIKGGRLLRPKTRFYTDSNQQRSIEKVIERNEYWETTIRDGRRTLVQREFDDSGRAIRSSDAIKHLMSNSHEYKFDCSTPMPILALVSTMDVIGEDAFNKKAGRINLSGWFDQYDQTKNDGGLRINLREAMAGDVSINGRKSLEGEYALFDTNKGDKLIPGGGYYFDLPGDKSSPFQGWNSVYLGRSGDNGYLFWTADLGTQNIHFNKDSWVPSNSRFKNHYLSAYTANPDVSRLVNWDKNHLVS